ncbi:hypothetical protein B0T16DRAFT_325 [Cercophora newfieldiana]|uniref:Uncharacterized protein n=1 Tax=Cercophora newfieldiana TaxID=92897 RepID=A0AA40CY19_9PEZI|nr:hypothetical protein B0T16DRAFT_325 [Cercophora newfieldiana]
MALRLGLGGCLAARIGRVWYRSRGVVRASPHRPSRGSHPKWEQCLELPGSDIEKRERELRVRSLQFRRLWPSVSSATPIWPFRQVPRLPPSHQPLFPQPLLCSCPRYLPQPRFGPLMSRNFENYQEFESCPLMNRTARGKLSGIPPRKVSLESRSERGFCHLPTPQAPESPPPETSLQYHAPQCPHSAAAYSSFSSMSPRCTSPRQKSTSCLFRHISTNHTPTWTSMCATPRGCS